VSGDGEEWAAACWPAVSVLKARGRWGAGVGRGGEAARLLLQGGAARQAAEGRAGGSRPAGGGGFVVERPEEEDEGVGPVHQRGRGTGLSEPAGRPRPKKSGGGRAGRPKAKA
jgi:hypothetical protein